MKITYVGDCRTRREQFVLSVTENMQPISWKTFLKHTNCKEELKTLFPHYEYRKGVPGLRLWDDWSVSFFRSKYVRKGRTIWYYIIRWSAIEFFWRVENDHS